MRRCCRQQKASRAAADEPPEFVALGIFDFAIEAARRCASSTTTRAQSAAAISLACSVSERDAMSSCTIKGLRSTKGLPVTDVSICSRDSSSNSRANLSVSSSLLDEVAGRHDEAGLQVSTNDKLFDQRTGYDDFAGARIVSEQVAERPCCRTGSVTRSHAIPCRPDIFVITRQHERVSW